MEKIKVFFTEHKKAIIIGTAVIVTAAVGAVAYKLKLDKTLAFETIADAAEEINPEAIGEIVTNG